MNDGEEKREKRFFSSSIKLSSDLASDSVAMIDLKERMAMRQYKKSAPRPAPEGLEPHAKMVWDKAESCGWAVVYTSSKADALGHAYTVGLFENFGHPDLMVAGMPQRPSAVALNQLAVRVAEGENFEVIEDRSDVFDKKQARFALMDPEWARRLMGLNELYRPLADQPCVQILWPDEDGVFPNEPGCDPSAFSRQPVCSSRPKKQTGRRRQ